jgi:hypothetical protein
MTTVRTDLVGELWAGLTEAARANPDAGPEEVRDRVERRGPSLTTEPGGTACLEVEVAGLPPCGCALTSGW